MSLNLNKQLNRYPPAMIAGVATASALQTSTVFPQEVGEMAYSTDTFQFFVGRDPATGGSFYTVPTGQAQVRLTNQGATIAATTLQSPPVAGLYRLSAYLETTTAGAAGTVTLTYTWADDTGAETLNTINVFSLAAGGYAQTTVVIYAVTGTAIKYATTVAGAVGSPKYALTILLERLF